MRLTNYAILFTIILLVSCKQPIVTFTKTQPENVNSLNKIPTRLHGEYFSVSDSATLAINRHLITKIYVIKDTIPNQKYIDTIFCLTSGNVLKKLKGYYFLNTQTNSKDWEVKTLKLKKGVLTISEISSDEEITNLEEITETFRDTLAPFKVDPSKKQFKEFISENGFRDDETYIRLK